MVSTSAEYRLIAANLDRSLATTAAKPSVAVESRYYLDHIDEIRSIGDFIRNTRVFNYAMKAFGLEDMTQAKGLVRKILEGGLDDPKSLGNRIGDDRFRELAATFNFVRDGENATDKTAARQGVVDRYVRQTLEADAGDDNQGVRLALYFQRKAADINSYYDILADAALTKVVKTALGLPEEMSSADIDRQVAAISARLSLADLKDPEKLDRLLTRFAAGYDAEDTTNADPILALFDPSSGPTLDLDLILQLQKLKHGG
ncbi:MAG TPA: DUF1217 domain-containing protein [Bauldia sp.]|nr:DUF1217 domain-containing protein [Bauldia sp.]